MSFSFETKNEICKNKITKLCCKKGLAYGFLLFGKDFSSKSISIQTENEETAKLYADMLAAVCNVYVDIKTRGHRKNTHKRVYLVDVPDKEQRLSVLKFFGHSKDDINVRINFDNFTDECCVKSFVKGVFLACGLISDPSREYHLEFCTVHSRLSKDFSELLNSLSLPPKTIIRKSSIILYYKESENIEDLLTIAGAPKKSMEIMNIKIYKEIKNTANRITNCDTANIAKTVEASALQLKAIEKLKKVNELEALPPELKELAKLRTENPELTLRELGQALKNPISRSGVNHRMKKIIEISDNLKI